MASELANPMDPFLRGVGASVPMIATAQAPGRYIRRAQREKFFTYLHAFQPGIKEGWIAGAINIADSFNVDGDADFCVAKQARLAFDTNNQVQLDDSIQFQVSPVSEGFNFVETYLAAYGSGRFPNQLSTPLVLPRSAIFTALASNRSASGLLSTIYFAHHGYKLYRNPFIPQRVYRQQKPYTYAASWGGSLSGAKAAVPAASTDIFALRTDGDSDFDVRRITITSDAAITIQIRTDDDNWFLRALRGELFGASAIQSNVAPDFTTSGELPFFLPVPRLVSGAGYINVQVTNQDAVNANRVQVTFWGTRLYPAGGIN